MIRPNFIFIMTDSQGANNIAGYGYPEMITPNLDRLMTESVSFNRAYSSTPICGPARGGIFTGCYPHSCGVWGNEFSLALTAKTMGQRFHDQGYRTAYVGKWHLSGQDYFDTGICPEGWEDEFWYDGRCYLAELTDDEIFQWRQVLTSEKALLEHDVPAEFTWGHRISDRAISFLQQPQEKPFVLALSYDEPHGPCTCPKEYFAPYENYLYDAGPNRRYDMSNKPLVHQQIRERARKDFTEEGFVDYTPFFACNSFVDAEIGRVLAAIDEWAPPNTWVIFTSDHGQFMGAHGLCGKGLAMYDESARIPFIIRSPERKFAGSMDVTLVSHVDILPTMLELAGLPVPPALEGESLKRNICAGENNLGKSVVVEWNRADADVHSQPGLFPVRCLLSDKYKLVINLFDTDELYDMQADPYEMNNLIAEEAMANVRDKMHGELLQWMDEKRDTFRGDCWRNRPWHQAAPPITHGKARPDDGYLPPTLDYTTAKPKYPA